MSDLTLFEKLQLKDEKNILIQGIPSTIEKQFIKISFAKCVTPLLKIKKIDFALVFAVSKKQLCEILTDVIPVLQKDPKFWIAYPKLTSKIASDLNRTCKWEVTDGFGFEPQCEIAIDSTWTAVQFVRVAKATTKKPTEKTVKAIPNIDLKGRAGIVVQEELKVLFKKNRPAELVENISTGKKNSAAR